MSRTIPLSQNFVTVVDDADYEWLTQWRWCFARGYAVRTDRSTGKKLTIRMHRLIVGVSAGLQVDHINGDKLDNRRRNLRIVSHGGNSANRPKFKQANGRQTASRYKGVHKRAESCSKPWFAQISARAASRKQGYFATEIEAAVVYDEMARELHGDCAWLNFPNETKG